MGCNFKKIEKEETSQALPHKDKTDLSIQMIHKNLITTGVT